MTTTSTQGEVACNADFDTEDKEDGAGDDAEVGAVEIQTKRSVKR